MKITMQNSIKFIGHSTVLIDICGVKILTDPNLARFVFGMPRLKMINTDIDDLNQADIILISHPHRDHLNHSTLRKISKKIPIAIHNESKKHLEEHKFKKIIGFEYWQERVFFDKKVKLTFVPAKHKRTLLLNPKGKSGGFVIETSETNIYFAGDTAFDKDIFSQIAEKFKIGIVLMPIGAYYPRWILKNIHTDPEEALRAMEIIGAEKMIPIHWGSFMMSLDTPNESAEVLKEKIKETPFEKKVLILKNGETHYF